MLVTAALLNKKSDHKDIIHLNILIFLYTEIVAHRPFEFCSFLPKPFVLLQYRLKIEQIIS